MLLGLSWQVALIFAAVWLAVAFLFRYSSLAALTAAVVVPIALYFWSTPRLPRCFVVMSVIVFIKHRANIARLLAGTEAQDRSEGMSKPAAGPRLSDRQRLHWLRLIRTPNVGPATFRDLINRFGSAEAALEMLPELMMRAAPDGSSRIPSVAEAEAELRAAGKNGARFVGIGEADYPPMLKRMDYPPPLLAVKGEAAVFSPAGGRHCRRPQRLARRHQDGAHAGGGSRPRGLCHRLRPGARHRHGGA